MHRCETVLFDLDGTLLDSVDHIVDSFHHTFRVHGLPLRSRQEILAGMGIPLKTVLGQMTDDPAIVEQWIATYREYNIGHHDERVRAYPGTVDMVRRIRASGRRTALVTSKNRVGAVRGIATLGLTDTIEVIVGADDVVNPKPHAEPVEKALAELDMPKGSCFFVGDSHHDVLSGQSAGVRTIGVTWGPFDRAHLEKVGPDHYCTTPDDVLAVLGIA